MPNETNRIPATTASVIAHGHVIALSSTVEELLGIDKLVPKLGRKLHTACQIAHDAQASDSTTTK